MEPVSGNPSYHVCRSILVKEPAAETQSEKSTETSEPGGESEESESEDEEAGQQPQTEQETGSEPEIGAEPETEVTVPDETEMLPEEALDAALEEAGRAGNRG